MKSGVAVPLFNNSQLGTLEASWVNREPVNGTKYTEIYYSTKGGNPLVQQPQDENVFIKHSILKIQGILMHKFGLFTFYAQPVVLCLCESKAATGFDSLS